MAPSYHTNTSHTANTCGLSRLSLAVGASCTIDVTFEPTEIGTHTSTLSITDKAPGSPHTASLSGTGTVVKFNLAPNLLRPGLNSRSTSSPALVFPGPTPWDRAWEPVSLPPLALRSSLFFRKFHRRSLGQRQFWRQSTARVSSIHEANRCRVSGWTVCCVYGDVATNEMMEAHSKVVGLALNGAQPEHKAS
jgi:hypothetical protein